MPSLLEGLEQSGLRGGTAERVVYAALAGTQQLAMVLQIVDGVVVVQYPGSGAGAMIIGRTDEAALAAVGVRVRELSRAGLELCLVSDDPGDERKLLKSLPSFLARAVPVYRVSSDGKVHHVAKVPVVKPALYQVIGSMPAKVTQREWEQLVPTRAAAEESWRASLVEAARWAGEMSTRPAHVTRALVGIIAVVFALEMVLGTDTPAWALRRLGALDAQRLFSGDWWLAASATFLHGGPMHVLFNGFVLWALGHSLERVLGSARFVVIYGLSGVAGALVSAWRMSEGGLSVGASGALWGLLAAEALLVVLPSSPLPAPLRERARQSVATNLGLNVVNSFMPHVDWAAHLGGGVAGALVTLALVRVRGTRTPSWLTGGAGVVAAFYVAGLGMALIKAELPVLMDARARTTVSVGELHLRTVELPSLVAGHKRVGGRGGKGSVEVVFGEVRRDPVVVGIVVAQHGDASPLDDQARGVLDAVKDAHDGTWLNAPSISNHGDTRWVSGRLKFNNGAVVDSVFVVEQGRWARVEVVLWPDALETWGGTAQEVAASVRWE